MARGTEARVGVVVGTRPDRGIHGGVEIPEAVGGDRGQQRREGGEVAQGRAVREAGAASDLAQPDPVEPLGVEVGAGGVDQAIPSGRRCCDGHRRQCLPT